ncbi:hypothetical protein DFH08DRAFT_814036 [Mycena albidolilacea]|uniref:Uncharacterized protein n=1 Tax=Mycena albidolilacea TaxID=1033008 RepID=A0AAD6ZQ26_9AGAR|nr:hypothetical protein DFH08DRAFT_814036 [Mycena albidolilacea]
MFMTSLAGYKVLAGEYGKAITLARGAQRLARLSSNLYREAEALKTEAYCWDMLGNFQHSLILLYRARNLVELCDMLESTLGNAIWYNQAYVHQMKSEYAQARQIAMEITQATSPDQYVDSHVGSLLRIAMIDILIGGSKHEVTCMVNNAKMLCQSASLIDMEVYCEIIIACLKLREGDCRTAREIFLKYLWTKPEVNEDCLEEMANIENWGKPNLEETSTWSVVYLAYSIKFQERLALYKALLFLGKIFLINKEDLTAESLFTVALDGFTYMDIHHSRADCMLYLGDLACRQGKFTKASTLWKEARPLFECSLQALGISRIDGRLAELEQQHGVEMESLARLNVPIIPPNPMIIIPGSPLCTGTGEEVEAQAENTGILASV